LFAGAALAALASPALADHMGPGSAGSGGVAVFAPDTLDEGHWGLGLRFAYTRPEQRPDAELETLAGEHVHAHNSRYNLNGSFAVAYGLTHELTLSAELPYVRRDRLREGSHAHSGGVAVNGIEQLGTVGGIGDMNLLAKYRLTSGEGLRVAVVGGVKVPTGGTHERSPDGERLETEHQPGTGSWDPILGASAARKVGDVQVTASALYQIAGKGAQRTRLGDRFQGGISVGRHFGPAEHEHHHDEGDEHPEHAEHRHQEHKHDSWDAFVELGGEWEGRQTIAGEVERASGGWWTYVAPGFRFNAASGWSAGAAVALPLSQHVRQSHPDNRFRLIVSLANSL
jgi:hypothetical protein